jgi:putative hydrolase of the HAD superfamily
MNKLLLLDLDGLVIRPRHKYFSEKYSEEYGIPLEIILTFFKGEYKRSAIGEVDIKEVLPEYLTKWDWKGTVDEFLKYWFVGEKDVDEKVLEVVRGLRQKGVKVYLVSNNEVRRAKYLMEDVGLVKEFDGSFFSCNLGVTKSDPKFFEKVVKGLHVRPGEVEYWDSDPKNVDVAKSVRIRGRVYESFEEFEESMKLI